MKKILLLSLLMILSIPAFAGVEGNASNEEQEFGKTFLPLASDFGMTNYAYAAKSSPVSVLYEYLPQNQNFDSWKQLSSVNIFQLGDKAEEVLPKLAESFQAKGAGKVVNETKTFGTGSSQVYFTDYVIGSGPIREHNLSMIWQILPGVIANFQIQKRDGNYSKDIKEEFLGLVKKTAKPE